MNIDELVSQMTIKEKAALCIGGSAWCTTSVRRLGIPEIIMTDGPHGLRRVENVNESHNIASLKESIPATCFPTASALAASWDVELIKEVGETIGEECIAQDVDIILGPGNNMKRTPLCGRNFEYFSEDPYLGGDLSAAFINGVQSKGVGATLKHFIANNQEYKRNTMSSEVDERTLREIYLRTFEIAIKKSRPWAVMCSYNKLNGTYCSESYELLTQILREEWKFDGIVMSDWGAIHDRIKSLKAGVDLEMPGPKKNSFKQLMTAIRNGELDEEILSKTAKRILKTIVRRYKVKEDKRDFDVNIHHSIARKTASESMVLLKNERDILPIEKPELIAIIGKAAKNPKIQGGGSSLVTPTNVDIPYEEIKKIAEGSKILYEEGYTMEDELNQEMINRAKDVAKIAKIALLFIALPPNKEFESYDRDDMHLSKQQVELIKSVSSVQPNTVVILNNGSPISMKEWIDDVPGVLQAWLMGQGGGKAVADILFGRINPSGKIAETFPVKLSDNPAYINYPGENDRVIYGEGIFVGYRYYDKKQIDVQFPFGYGLSYTTFEYSNLKVSSSKFRDIDGLALTVDVTNTGKMAGKEIVQLYVMDRESKLARPIKELKRFAKVDLRPGETKTISFNLDMQDFAYYSPQHKSWVTENGEFDIMVGKSSREICLTNRVNLISTTEISCTLNYNSTIREWLEDERGREIIENLSKNIMNNKEFQQISKGANIDMWKAAQDTQLIFILKQMAWSLPLVPDMIMSRLLTQVHGRRNK
ncbi:MAG: glycoside hydrolase family 3 C-terminal domain-containing protein [Clostridia bacterium]|nr:glycoside hydrolase family 3 C-terminal domain-containing protein [Clostridia bacterium]